MNLAFKEFGSGQAFVIIHGLYGSSDNWVSIARVLEKKYRVIIPDMRNHGDSENTATHSYAEMVHDLYELFTLLKLEKAIILGHSMGGKTAMLFTAQYPELTDKLIVADISPFNDKNNAALKALQNDHRTILNNLNSLPIASIKSRSEAEQHMKQDISNVAVRQFLLKNLKRNNNKQFEWKINVPVLKENLSDVLDEITLYPYKDKTSNIPVLFIKGALSPYLPESDFELIQAVFTDVQFEIIEKAGHWIHAEQPEQFLEIVSRFTD